MWRRASGSSLRSPTGAADPEPTSGHLISPPGSCRSEPKSSACAASNAASSTQVLRLCALSTSRASRPAASTICRTAGHRRRQPPPSARSPAACGAAKSGAVHRADRLDEGAGSRSDLRSGRPGRRKTPLTEVGALGAVPALAPAPGWTAQGLRRPPPHSGDRREWRERTQLKERTRCGIGQLTEVGAFCERPRHVHIRVLPVELSGEMERGWPSRP